MSVEKRQPSETEFAKWWKHQRRIWGNKFPKQEELAEYLGIFPQQVSQQMMRGTPSQEGVPNIGIKKTDVLYRVIEFFRERYPYVEVRCEDILSCPSREKLRQQTRKRFTGD